MHMTFEQEELESKSTLKKTFDCLIQEKVSWQWSVDGKKKTDSFISILFEPPEPEPEKGQEQAESKKEAEKKPPAAEQKAGPAGAKPEAQKAATGVKK